MSTASTIRAPADTLLGQLQRRRGAGYRAALRLPAREVEPLVFACIAHDPRWDPQCEWSHTYYPGLLLHFASDLAPIERLLREDDPSEWGHGLGLAFGTLRELGLRGRPDALAVLRGYVEYGRHWQQAVSTLQRIGRPEAWQGLLDVLLARFPSGQELGDLECYLTTHRPPTAEWRAACPPLDQAFRARETWSARRPSRAALRKRYRELPLEQLFTEVDTSNAWVMRRVLPRRVRASDRALLHSHLRPDDKARCALALYGVAALGARQDWEALRSLVEANPDLPRFFWGHLARASVAFPARHSLATARAWWGSAYPLRAHLARLVLAEHAEAPDLERLLAAIPPALVEDDMDHLSSALEGIARIPPAGRLPEVERAFEEATYTHTRRRAAEAMIVHSPAHFVDTYATECLWDVDPWIRLLGCDYADRALPEVQERLAELAADPYEDRDVIEAASSGEA